MPSAACPATPDATKPRFRAGILVAALAAATYAITLGNGFVYDDTSQILENPWLQSVRHIPDILSTHVWGFNPRYERNYYRPIMHIVNLAVFQAAGPRPWAFHLVSVGLHAAAAAAVYRVLLLLFGGGGAAGARRGALLGGLIFAVHPMNVEAVAWIGSLPDLLCGLFALLAIERHLESERPGDRAWGWSFIWMSAALLSKETAVVIPGLLLAAELFRGAWRDPHGLVVRLAMPVLLAAASLGLRTAVMGSLLPRTATAIVSQTAERMPEILVILLEYARKLVFPWPANFAPGLPRVGGFRDALLAPGAWLLAGTAVLALGRGKRASVAALALCFFFVPLAPALFASIFINSPITDRYLYLPGVGAAIMLGWAGSAAAAGRAWESRSWRTVFLVALAALAGAASIRAADFKDNLAIWGDAALKSPGVALARGNYASALFAAGRYDEGVREAREAIRLEPWNPDFHFNLALASERAQLLDIAAEEYGITIALGYEDEEVRRKLAGVFLQQKDFERARENATRAVVLDPANAESRYLLGRALASLGDYPGAAAELDAASRLKPAEATWREEAALATRLAKDQGAPPYRR